MDHLEKAIKLSTKYAKERGQYLNSQLIAYRLISDRVWSEKEISQKWKEISGKTDRITNTHPVKLERAKAAGEVLEKIPWVKMVAVTGSVAMDNSKINDDIDLFILTQSNRLWLTRIIALVWLTINGWDIKRTNKTNRADQLCLNLWLDERNLEIVTQKRTLGGAMDAINMKVVGGHKKYLQLFFEVNPWIGDFMASGYAIKKKKGNKITLDSKTNIILDGLNYLAYIVQRWYMKPKMTREIVDIGQAYFHPRLI